MKKGNPLAKGLLERYESISKSISKNQHILDSYSSFLQLTKRPNTVTAYTTDVCCFCRDLFFPFDHLSKYVPKSDMQRLFSNETYLLSYEQENQENKKTSNQLVEIPANLTTFSQIPANMREEDLAILDLIFRRYGTPGTRNFVMNQHFWDESLSPETLVDVLTYQQKNGNCNNTIGRKIYSLRNFGKFLLSRRLISKLTLFEIYMIPAPSKKKRAQIYLSDNELMKFYAYVEKTRKIACHLNEDEELYVSRNRPLLYFLASLLRGSAICNLRMQDLDLTNKILYVTEKGDKEIEVPLVGILFDSLEQYILEYRQRFIERYNVSKQERDFIFHTKRGTKMDRYRLSNLVDEYAKAAGIRRNVRGRTRITTHVFRRSIADSISRNGGSIQALGHAMKHKHLSTTYNYLNTDNPDEVRQLHQKYNIILGKNKN